MIASLYQSGFAPSGAGRRGEEIRCRFILVGGRRALRALWPPAPPARYGLAKPPLARLCFDEGQLDHFDFPFLPREMTTCFMTTSVVGLSRGPRSTLAILVTSDSGSHLPKMVWRPFR